MSLADALLRAVIADPDDDAPRLIYADSLDENGDPERAEFIRVQCEQARTPCWERRWQELAWRGEALLSRHGPRWRGNLPALDGVRWTEFDRGFPATVRVRDLETLYRQDAALAVAAPVTGLEVDDFNESQIPCPKGSLPWLRRLRFDRVLEQTIRAHPTRSLLSRIRELEVVNVAEYDTLPWLASACPRRTLTDLRLHGSHTVCTDLIRRLGATDWGETLTRLDVGTRFVNYNSGYFEDPQLGAERTRSFALLCRCRRLEALNLDRQAIGADGFAALLASPRLAGLRALSVRSCAIEDVSSFPRSTGKPFDRLDLSDNPIGAAGAGSLADAPRLHEVKSLILDTCEIDAEGLERLTASPLWRSLRRLDLSRNPLGYEGAQVLARADPPPHLHALRLVDCDLDSDAVEVLAAVPWLRQLQTLDLSGNPLEALGVAGLTGLAGGALRELGLAHTGLDADALTSLVALLPQLVVLDLGEAARPDATPLFDRLCQEAGLRLQVLRLRHCSFFDLLGVLRRLVEAPVARQLVELDLAHGFGLGDEAALLLANAPALAGLTRLDLRRQGSFAEATLLALARSPHLANVVDFRLTADAYYHRGDVRRELLDRFGRIDEDDDAPVEEWGNEDL